MQDKIKGFWEQVGEDDKVDGTATMKDTNQRQIEVENICGEVKPEDNVLDMGCGNGFLSLILLNDIGVKSIVGIDYADNMIKYANKKLESLSEDLKQKVSFKTGDVLNIPEEDNKFNCVVSERCLINLDTIEKQKQALKEICRVLKKDGRYVMMEYSKQGRDKLNEFRRLHNLTDSANVWHNLDIDENEFIPFARTLFDIVKVKRFGMYYFLSRLVHPLIIAPEEPKHASPINNIAYSIYKHIPDYMGMGQLVMYVFKKK